MPKEIKPGCCAAALLGSVVLAFGLYHVHSFANITEGGVLGMTLLLQRWFGVSPALSSLVMNLICYAIGWRELGKDFMVYSAVACLGFSLSYRVFECFPPLWPQLCNTPLLAAVVGALFVGIGVGICVRAGGAPSGDDALAMSLSHKWKVKIERVYLISDLTVLALSLTYIPLMKIVYSLVTVVLSGQIIGFVQRVPLSLKGNK